MVYEHLRPLIFTGGNEYRRFETVSTGYPGMGVETITFEAPVYNMWLSTDTPRAFSPYSYDSTQHGRFFIRESSSSRSDTEADYVMTHFSLEMPELTGQDVFLDGDFVQRRFDPLSRMVYNRATGATSSRSCSNRAPTTISISPSPPGRHAARPHPWRAISIRPSTNTP